MALKNPTPTQTIRKIITSSRTSLQSRSFCTLSTDNRHRAWRTTPLRPPVGLSVISRECACSTTNSRQAPRLERPGTRTRLHTGTIHIQVRGTPAPIPSLRACCHNNPCTHLKELVPVQLWSVGESVPQQTRRHRRPRRDVLTACEVTKPVVRESAHPPGGR